MNAWEANDNHRLFELLVGDWYGENPEDRTDLIKKDKEQRARKICEYAAINKNSIVLEIGSGLGYASRHVANLAGHLHCCDISNSFLNYAKNECQDVSNISFHKIDEPPILPFSESYFDAVFADAVFIHLNIYDIYSYFFEFAKVVKPGGVVWINVMDDFTIDFEKLKQMAGFYNLDRRAHKSLLSWNSVNAIVQLAKHFGFALQSKHYEVTVELKFKKTNSK